MPELNNAAAAAEYGHGVMLRAKKDAAFVELGETPTVPEPTLQTNMGNATHTRSPLRFGQVKPGMHTLQPYDQEVRHAHGAPNIAWIRSQQLARARIEFQIMYPDGSHYEFHAYVGSVGRENPADDFFVTTINIVPDGPIGDLVEASGG
jgi:hypothetical protein